MIPSEFISRQQDNDLSEHAGTQAYGRDDYTPAMSDEEILRR